MIIKNMTQDEIIRAIMHRADISREEWRKSIGTSTDVNVMRHISAAWDEAVEIARGMGSRYNRDEEEA